MALYRFMNIEKTMDVLNNKRLTFSNPLYFNDPFDCSLAINDSDEEYIRKYEEYSTVPIQCGSMVFKNPYTREINAYTNLINKAVSDINREKIEKSTSKLGIQSEQIRLCAVNYELHSKSQPHTEEQ